MFYCQLKYRVVKSINIQQIIKDQRWIIIEKYKVYLIQTNNQNVFKKYIGIFARIMGGILYAKVIWVAID